MAGRPHKSGRMGVLVLSLAACTLAQAPIANMRSRVIGGVRASFVSNSRRATAAGLVSEDVAGLGGWLGLRRSSMSSIGDFRGKSMGRRRGWILSLRRSRTKQLNELKPRAAPDPSPESVADLRERYEAFDMDGDSWLNVDELRNVLECSDSFCLNKHWLPMDQVERILKMYDTEGTGRIGFHQFVNLAQDKQLLEGKLDEYLAAFQALDKDGSGFIDHSELQAYLETSGTAEKEASLFNMADIDGDDKIDFAEFLGMVRAQAFDMQSILSYLEMPPASEFTAAGTIQLPTPGEVNMIKGKYELDFILEHIKTPVVLMMAFHWCRPCKGFSRKYERFAEGFKDITFLKVYGDDTEETKLLVKSLGVKASPSFYIYKDGEFEKTFKGANEERFRSSILALQNGNVSVA